MWQTTRRLFSGPFARAVWFVIVGSVLILPACYPGGPETVSDLDLVATIFDTKYDYGMNKTYKMPDSVLHVFVDGDTITVSRQEDPTILNTIDTNMQNLNYTKVPINGPDPDVVVLAAVVIQRKYVGWVSGGCWWWWGCISCFCGYPPQVGQTQYDAGTIMIDMADQSRIDSTQNTAGIVWGAAANGILATSSASNTQRVVDAINQAFSQSQYLQSR